MKRKTEKGRRLCLTAMVACLALGLSGCYAPPPAVDATGDLYPEYPSRPTEAAATVYQPIVTVNASAGAEPETTPYTGGIIVVSGTSTPTARVIVINTQTPSATIPAATPVQSTPTAVPTATSSALRNGSQGDTVRDMQRKLKKLGFYSGSIDGDFGPGTEAAAALGFKVWNGVFF